MLKAVRFIGHLIVLWMLVHSMAEWLAWFVSKAGARNWFDLYMHFLVVFCAIAAPIAAIAATYAMPVRAAKWIFVVPLVFFGVAFFQRPGVSMLTELALVTRLRYFFGPADCTIRNGAAVEQCIDQLRLTAVLYGGIFYSLTVLILTKVRHAWFERESRGSSVTTVAGELSGPRASPL